jgi:hypothetical protein
MVMKMHHQIDGGRAISKGYRAPQPTTDGLLVEQILGIVLNQTRRNSRRLE